jgi:hypothetical protein
MDIRIDDFPSDQPVAVLLRRHSDRRRIVT